jgi:hypothetical protein
VRDQGDRPTCVAFAVSAAHEWMEAAGQLRSPEDALWAAHQEGGPPGREDTSVALAMAGLARLDHADEPAWPYGNPRWPADRPATAQLDGSRRALPPWRQLANDWDELAREVDDGNAVVLTLAFVPMAWRVTEVDAPPTAKTRTNHAVLAVGVRGADGDANQALIIKNSWGPDWGDEGYGFVSRRYIEAFLVRAHVLEQ